MEKTTFKYPLALEGNDMEVKAARALKNGDELTGFFADLCPKSYRTYLSGFLKCLSFSESLTLSWLYLRQKAKGPAFTNPEVKPPDIMEKSV